MLKRRRFKQTKSLKSAFSKGHKIYGTRPRCFPMDQFATKKAGEIEAAARIEDWLNSPVLRPPKKNDSPGPNQLASSAETEPPARHQSANPLRFHAERVPRYFVVLMRAAAVGAC